jgi:hypothetical protein
MPGNHESPGPTALSEPQQKRSAGSQPALRAEQEAVGLYFVTTIFREIDCCPAFRTAK